MKIEYKDKEYKTKVVEDTNHVIVYDNEGNRYRIKADKFGGIEIMNEDGHTSIEPNVSNVVTIKTLK